MNLNLAKIIKDDEDAINDRILDAIEGEAPFDAVVALIGVLSNLVHVAYKEPPHATSLETSRAIMTLLGFKRKDGL